MSDKRPIEQETVRTTIVGGRPPGSGQPLGPIPRGIEVLVKKAAVDADFKHLLLEKRADAAKEIGLALEPAEAMMLAAAPRAQLETIIAQTNVAPSLRAAFLGRAAAVMLVALGAGAMAVAGEQKIAGVVAKDLPSIRQPAQPAAAPIPAAIPATDAAAVEARITKEYLQAFTDLTVHHGVSAKTIRISVAMGDGGSVQSLQFQNPAEGGPVGFREELSGQIMKWKFPDLRRACNLTVLMESPREITGVLGGRGEMSFAVAGATSVMPTQPTAKQPGRAIVFPDVPPVTKDEAAAVQARILKDDAAAFAELAGRRNETGKAVRMALVLDGKGGVQLVQFLRTAQDTSEAFRVDLAAQAIKWTFPDVKTAGTVTVTMDATKEAAAVKPGAVTAEPGIVPADGTAGAAVPTGAATPPSRRIGPVVMAVIARPMDGQ